MAEVYLAQQLSLGRKVALKVLRAELATDATYLQRFELEARAAASLVHGSIVQIYEVGCLDGVHFIAQEYVSGQNLAELLRRKGTLPVEDAVNIMRQVAVALDKANEQGIVHRDIKPDNLMLSTSGEVKVADFGLARVSEGSEKQKLTQIGITMGSPLYMSPEQAEGRPLDTRSDIYSFGATCFEMLSGRPPFEGETALSVAVQHVKSPPPRLETLRPDLPIDLCRIVHQMLAKNPAERQANGAALLRGLRSLNQEQPDTTRPPIQTAATQSLDNANTAEAIALAKARQAATQHLALVMQQEQDEQPFYRHPFFLLAAVSGLIVGGLLAWPSDEPSLLEVQPAADNQVERMANARTQYLFALQADTETAMLAVEEHFPENQHYVVLADKQLASRYLEENRLAEAEAIFDEFAQRGDRDFRAYGQAGQYVVQVIREDRAAAAAPLAKLMQGGAGEPTGLKRLAKFDPAMARRVAQIMRLHRREVEGSNNAEIDAWLERVLSESSE